MILGLDVYHCSERQGESVCATVATMDVDQTKYFSTVSFHKLKNELATTSGRHRQMTETETEKCLDLCNGKELSRTELCRVDTSSKLIR